MSSAKDSMIKVENMDAEEGTPEMIDDKESVLRPYLGLLELNSAIYDKLGEKADGAQEASTSENFRNSSSTEQKTFRCPFCPFTVIRSTSMQSHLKHHQKPPAAYRCRLCTFSSDIPISVTFHEQRVHKVPSGGTSSSVAASRRRSAREPLPNFCPTDDNEASTSRASNGVCVQRPLASQPKVASFAQKRVVKRCPECPFRSEKNFKTHMLHHCKPPLAFVCPYCTYSSDSSSAIVGHKKLHKAVAAGTTTSFSSLEDTKMSINSAALQNKFASVDPRYRRSLQKCPYPGCAYYGQKILKHIRHHQVRMKYKCDQCSFTSNFTKGILTHKRKHAEHDAEVVAAVINTEQQGPLSSGFAKAPSKKRKKHKCFECPFSSSSHTLLEKHQRHHFFNPSASFRCFSCTYSTDAYVALAAHSQIHKGAGGGTEVGLDATLVRQKQRKANQSRARTALRRAVLRARNGTFVSKHTVMAEMQQQSKCSTVGNKCSTVTTAAAENLPQTKMRVPRSQPSVREGPTASTVSRRTTLNSTFSAGLRHLPPTISMYMGSVEGDDVVLRRRHSDGRLSADVATSKEDAKSANSFVRKFAEKATGILSKKNAKAPAMSGDGVAGLLRSCLRDVSPAHSDGVSLVVSTSSSRWVGEKTSGKTPKGCSDVQLDKAKTQSPLSTITYTITTTTAMPSSTTAEQSVDTTATTTTSSTTLNTTINFLPCVRPPPVYILPRLRGVLVCVERFRVEALLREHCAVHRIILPTEQSVCEALAADYASRGLTFLRKFFAEGVEKETASIEASPTTARPRRSTTNQRDRFFDSEKMLSIGGSTHYCVNCHREFQKKSTYVFHVLNRHNIFLGDNSMVSKYVAALAVDDIKETIFRCEFCLSDWTTIDEWVAHRVGVHDPTYRPTFVVGIIKGALSALGGQARRSVLDEENAENGDGDDEGEKNDGEEKKEDYAVYRPISDSAKRRVSNDLALGEWHLPKKHRHPAALPASLLASRGILPPVNYRRPQFAIRGSNQPQTARRGRNGWRSGIPGVSMAQLMGMRCNRARSPTRTDRQVDDNDELKSESLEVLQKSGSDQVRVIDNDPTDKAPDAPTASNGAPPTLADNSEGSTGSSDVVAADSNHASLNCSAIEVIVLSSDEEKETENADSGGGSSKCHNHVDEKPALLDNRVLSSPLPKNLLSGSFITESVSPSGEGDDTSTSSTSDGKIRDVTTNSASFEQKQQSLEQSFFAGAAVAPSSGRRAMNGDDEEAERNARLAYEIMTKEAALFDRQLPQFFVADERLRAYTRVACALHSSGWRADGGGQLTAADVCRRWRFLIDQFKRERSEQNVSPAASVPFGHQGLPPVSRKGGCIEWYEAYCSTTSTASSGGSIIGKDVDQILDEEILRHAVSSVKDDDTASNSDLPSIASSVATIAASE